ncbi:FAD-dependent oxidoreductase [Microbacterium hominis]|uniref:FAD-dependent oxidoreductase n=1 Tax=Microbacterium hominis TaxID=162426 RepID=UPI00068D8F22
MAEAFDTIVIGAGIAGLTTARLLTDVGHHTVVVEARDRIGGRVWTDRSDGRVTDRGASWIHGIPDSPVAAAASAFGMRTVEFTVGGYQPDSRPMAHYSPEGARLSPAEAAAYVADIHAVDAALIEAITASGPLATYRDVTETALGAQGWPPERTQRVREYLEHRSEEQYGAAIADLAATVSTTIRSTATRSSSPTAMTRSRAGLRPASTSGSPISSRTCAGGPMAWRSRAIGASSRRGRRS